MPGPDHLSLVHFPGTQRSLAVATRASTVSLLLVVLALSSLAVGSMAQACTQDPKVLVASDAMLSLRSDDT